MDLPSFQLWTRSECFMRPWSETILEPAGFKHLVNNCICFMTNTSSVTNSAVQGTFCFSISVLMIIHYWYCFGSDEIQMKFKSIISLIKAILQSAHNAVIQLPHAMFPIVVENFVVENFMGQSGIFRIILNKSLNKAF